MKHLIFYTFVVLSLTHHSAQAIEATSLEELSISSTTARNNRQARIGLGREHGVLTQQAIMEMPLADVGMIQGKLSLGSSEYFSSSNGGEIEEALAAQVSFVRPLGESLYVLGGIFYRDYARKRNNQLDEFKDIGPTIAIGNRWTIKKFEMNVQWVGASPSIASIEDRGDRPELFLSLLNISAGVSF